jgi:hypothetical protein
MSATSPLSEVTCTFPFFVVTIGTVGSSEAAEALKHRDEKLPTPSHGLNKEDTALDMTSIMGGEFYYKLLTSAVFFSVLH